MKIPHFLLCMTLSFFPLKVFAQGNPNDGWAFTIGTGMVASPSYFGDDDYKLSILPNLQIKYKDKFFSSVQEGIGYNLVNNKNWRLGPIARYNFGRAEDGKSAFQISGDTSELRGLGDVDGTIEVGGFIEYKMRPVSAKIELLQEAGGHEGLIGKARISYGGKKIF